MNIQSWNHSAINIRLFPHSELFNRIFSPYKGIGVKMKTIGLIGGMSWKSSIEYYRIINEITRTKLGSLHSARSVMYSVDFADVEALQHQNRWAEAAELLTAAARNLENGGADFIVLCTNTMHK